MKAGWAAAAALLLSVPILAWPARWSADQRATSTRYVIGEPHGRGSRVVISCRTGAEPEILVSLDGTSAPPDSDIGFRAANRTIVMRSDDRGFIETRSEANRSAYASLLASLKAGGSLEIGYTNGASADLPLGEASFLAAGPCAAANSGPSVAT